MKVFFWIKGTFFYFRYLSREPPYRLLTSEPIQFRRSKTLPFSLRKLELRDQSQIILKTRTETRIRLRESQEFSTYLIFYTSYKQVIYGITEIING